MLILSSSDQERKNLEVIVKMLNDHDGYDKAWVNKDYGVEDAEKLRRIIEAWQKAREEHPYELTSKMKLSATDRRSLENATKGRHLTANLDGTLRLVFSGRRDPAAERFINLMGSTTYTQQLLGGKCANCECWYVRKTVRPSIYCSRPCAINGQKAKERKGKHDDLVEDINQAVLNYESLKPDSRLRRHGWKAYVIEATGVSPNMLTRLIKKGDARVPEGEENATH